jgi:Na+-transporting NADH:ubiquinone oxidoreductase subunit B
MKFLKNSLDKLRPHFEKGKKLHFFHSTFDAFETFLFVPDKVTTKGTHIRDKMDMKRNMIIVVISLMPPLLFGMWNIGYFNSLAYGIERNTLQMFWFGFIQVLPIIIVSYVSGLTIEFIIAQIRGHEVNEGFLVTGMLIPLIVPVDTPLWMISVATVFTVLIGKELFGGTGMNILNPALLTRAFLFFAYPSKMTGDLVWIANLSKDKGVVDGFTGATPLGDLALATSQQDLANFYSRYSISDLIIGLEPGSVGETSVIAIGIGAFILLYTGVASWRIILSSFIGGTVMGILLNIFATDTNVYMSVPFYMHLVMGGFAFGMVYMATDPVTGSQTNTGKWIYGFLCGFLSLIVRVLNPAYPEGVMLSILLMNVFIPLIDHYVVEQNIKRRLKRSKIITT